MDFSTGNDTESHKLARFFAFLGDDLKWTYGELLYYTTKGKAPGVLKGDSETSNKKDVHRNAAIIQHFMNGNGKILSPRQQQHPVRREHG